MATYVCLCGVSRSDKLLPEINQWQTSKWGGSWNAKVFWELAHAVSLPSQNRLLTSKLLMLLHFASKVEIFWALCLYASTLKRLVPSKYSYIFRYYILQSSQSFMNQVSPWSQRHSNFFSTPRKKLKKGTLQWRYSVTCLSSACWQKEINQGK